VGARVITALVVVTSAALVAFAFRAALEAERGRGEVVAAATAVLTEVVVRAEVAERALIVLRDANHDRSELGDLASGAAFRVREVAERGAVALLTS
jgi:hypothetical protein